MGTGTVEFIGEVVEALEDHSTIQIYPEYCPGLLGISEYSHIIVLYWFHERDNRRHRETLRVTPRRGRERGLTGVFACRSPSRPNPVGHTVVELLEADGCMLRVKGLDALQGSPVIDLKPFMPRSDTVQDAVTPDTIKQ